MASKKIVPIRIDQDMLDDIELAIRQAAEYNKFTLYTVGSWIRKAISEKIAHLERSRRNHTCTSSISITPSPTPDTTPEAVSISDVDSTGTPPETEPDSHRYSPSLASDGQSEQSDLSPTERTEVSRGD